MISEEERKNIERVRDRAKTLDRIEEIRIGCLNLQKKKRLGNGTSTCVVCDQNLSMLTSLNVCYRCNMAVCKQCKVDTTVMFEEPTLTCTWYGFTDVTEQPVTYCKVCLEEQELWCKSGAWFQRPPKVTLSDDKLKLLKDKLDLSRKPSLIRDVGCSQTKVPFPLLEGESPLFMDCFLDSHLLVLSNYRLFVMLDKGFYSLPLGLVEKVEWQHRTDLLLLCRNAQIIRLTLDSTKQCKRWFVRIKDAIKPPLSFRDTFAYIHYVHRLMWPSCDDWIGGVVATDSKSLLMSDYHRMGMDDNTGTWRITHCNSQYKLCSSYPKLLVVPRSVSDKELEKVASFRFHGQVPVIVWRNQQNGAVIARCGQPKVGIRSRRCAEDEKLLKSLSKSSVPPNATEQEQTIVLDLRSSSTAMGNRVKGGGNEQHDHYPTCKILYKRIPNIRLVCKNFSALRKLRIDTGNLTFLSAIEKTKWLHYISQLLLTSKEVAEQVAVNGRPVLVHSSDGWDSTPQVVSLAQLLLDPHYRTIEGFQTLVDKEWLSFGHKFADSNGKSDQSLIFLQWLDCVHQLVMQFPTAFEFNSNYLVKLAHHCYTRLFGTFLANCEQERESYQTRSRSVWPFLINKRYLNVLYSRTDTEMTLYPRCQLRSMFLWHDLYCMESLIPYGIKSRLENLDQDGMAIMQDAVQQRVVDLLAKQKEEQERNKSKEAFCRELMAKIGTQACLYQLSQSDTASSENEQVLTQSSSNIGYQTVSLPLVLGWKQLHSNQIFIVWNTLQNAIKTLKGQEKAMQVLVRYPLDEKIAADAKGSMLNPKVLPEGWFPYRMMLYAMQNRWFKGLISAVNQYCCKAFLLVDSMYKLFSGKANSAMVNIRHHIKEDTGPVVVEMKPNEQTVVFTTDDSKMNGNQDNYFKMAVEVFPFCGGVVQLPLSEISDQFLLGGPTTFKELHKWREGHRAGGYSLGDGAYMASLRSYASLPDSGDQFLRRIRMHSFLTAGNLTRMSKFADMPNLPRETILSCGIGLSMILENAQIRMDYTVPLKAQRSERPELRFGVHLDM